MNESYKITEWLERSNSKQSEPDEEEKNEEDDDNSKEMNIDKPNPFAIRNPFDYKSK